MYVIYYISTLKKSKDIPLPFVNYSEFILQLVTNISEESSYIRKTEVHAL